MQKKASKKVNTPKPEIYYVVTIPRADVLNLLHMDCERAIKQFSKLPGMTEFSAVFERVLVRIRNAWEQLLTSKKKPDASKKNPTNVKKVAKKRVSATLSKEEKGMIRALRKQGLSIKSIGKEIHRGEKLVRTFIKGGCR